MFIGISLFVYYLMPKPTSHKRYYLTLRLGDKRVSTFPSFFNPEVKVIGQQEIRLANFETEVQQFKRYLLDTHLELSIKYNSFIRKNVYICKMNSMMNSKTKELKPPNKV